MSKMSDKINKMYNGLSLNRFNNIKEINKNG